MHSNIGLNTASLSLKELFFHLLLTHTERLWCKVGWQYIVKLAVVKLKMQFLDSDLLLWTWRIMWQTCRRSAVGKWDLKKENTLHFNEQTLMCFVFLSSRLSVSKMSKATISNVVWQFEWVQLGEVFDFTMFKKKNVRRACVWTVPGASGWLGEARGGLSAGHYVPVIPCRLRGCDTFAVYPCHISFHCKNQLHFMFAIQEITSINSFLSWPCIVNRFHSG